MSGTTIGGKVFITTSSIELIPADGNGFVHIGSALLEDGQWSISDVIVLGSHPADTPKRKFLRKVCHLVFKLIHRFY
jgi:hypothetical protein